MNSAKVITRWEAECRNFNWIKSENGKDEVPNPEVVKSAMDCFEEGHFKTSELTRDGLTISGIMRDVCNQQIGYWKVIDKRYPGLASVAAVLERLKKELENMDKRKISFKSARNSEAGSVVAKEDRLTSGQIRRLNELSTAAARPEEVL